MNWLILALAGLVEVAWSQSIKPTQNFTRPLPTLICLALLAVAVWLLPQAIITLLVGIAYGVFTGIGAAGAIMLGIVLNDAPVSVGRMAALGLIVSGIVPTRVTT
ncbi:DMT family transporter [Streptomyces sp. NPDC057575]|uniref:DMT family transporter n=1 Tax=unclassified Streptomyces TaxID=2593676 RepID=UPI0036AB0A5D